LYLPKAGEVTLEVFNVLGQKVVTLTDGLKSAGKQTVVWDATDMRGNAVASGTYFYQLRSGGKILNKRMVLVK
jgi:flagellar hook assembly protein FlgD